MNPAAMASMWDKRYSATEYAYGEAPNTFVSERSAAAFPGTGKRILCLAEGEGRNAVFLAEQGHDVVGVDMSSVGLDKANALAEKKGVRIETQVANLADYDMGEGSWDGIVAIFAHFPPPVRARVLGSIARALRPGGALLLEGYTPAQLEYKTGGPPKAAMMFTKEILSDELESDALDFEYCEEVVRDINEGTCHTGKGAVVQLIARKK